MKFLIVIPFLFSLIGCMQLKGEQITGRPGGCVNGKCTNNHDSEKPQSCSSAATVFDFHNHTFGANHGPTDDGITFRTEYSFKSTNAFEYAQTCILKNQHLTTVSIPSVYAYYYPTKQLSFTQPGSGSGMIDGYNCQAQLVPAQYTVSFEGQCMILQDADGAKDYFELEN